MKRLILPFFCIFIFSVPNFAAAVDVQQLNVRLQYINQDFFARFNDPVLEEYILEALSNNNNLKKTAWQVEEYRQNVKLARAAQMPSLSVGANYLGQNTPYGLEGKNGFLLPFVLHYEADFLLKNKDKTSAAKKAHQAAEYEQKAVNIALLTDLAGVYVNIMRQDKLIELANELSDVKAKKLDIATKSYAAGVVGIENVNFARQEYEGSKMALNDLLEERDILISSLYLLLGESPDASAAPKRSDIDSFDYFGTLPQAISSDVTFSRPDVLAREAELLAAGFNVKAARKELFPTFNILGVLAYSTLFQGSFFSWDSAIAAILAGARQDIFTGGAKVARLKADKARYEQMFEQYRLSELTALKEVNDALCIARYASDTDALTLKNLELQRKNYKNAELKYKSGTISLFELSDEKEKLLKLEAQAASAKVARLISHFTLYKATGGSL